MEPKKRCKWANPDNAIYLAYHDLEWCVPTYDDRVLFELLLLESFQAGLSWECILNKREAFREAFDQFDPVIIANYSNDKVNSLLQNEKIIRNRLKIMAAIKNAKVFLAIQQEYQTFSNYIWSFTNHQIIYEIEQTSSPLSDRISRDLKTRGMSFVGTTILYSYLQAIGILYSHEKDCYKYHSQ